MVENVREEIEKELSNGRGIFFSSFFDRTESFVDYYYVLPTMKNYR